MATTLLQKLKDALKDDDLNADVKGDVAIEMLKIIATNNSCNIGLRCDDKLDAAERALKLFLAGWKNLVEQTNSMDVLHSKLKVLCLNACQIERRRTRAITDAPMGVRMGDDFPCTWEI
ncbi:MAG: hypothetical protein SPL78_10765 [Bacteroidales bacterium]|nr:hypothetical protein [Bacteroidales bacterium]